MKLALTVTLILGVALMLAWAPILGPVPTHHAELQRYAVRFGIYICCLLVIFFVTAVLAMIIARRAREEYRAEIMGNVKFLIESTLEDHRKKNEPPEA